MPTTLEEALHSLTPSQRYAADWDSGSLMVLAGPGSGKTRVLTTRIARILDDSSEDVFRVLALTFTNRAADEMRRRVERLVEAPPERLFIGTFHSFCATQLRLHGSHIGIDPDYGVYATEEDRKDLLRDALRDAAKKGFPVTVDDVRILRDIDVDRSRLNEPPYISEGAANFQPHNKFSLVYEIYQNALRESNVLDFNSMIFDTWRLAKSRPSFCRRIRRAYRYWLVDEFQDMSWSQYEILRTLAGEEFKNLFAVADEDQLIYSWRGASRDSLAKFQREFSAERIYFQENHRCPPDVIEAANRLIARNSIRDRSKPQAISVKGGSGGAIRFQEFPSDVREASAVAEYFASLGRPERDQSGVLARNRESLAVLRDAFERRGVRAVVMKGIREFISPQFRWIECCLDLAIRPHDRQRMRHLTIEAGRFANALQLDPDVLISEAEASMESYLEVWARAASRADDPLGARLAGTARRLLEARREWKETVTDAISYLLRSERTGHGSIADSEEDYRLWEEDSRKIFAIHGDSIELSEFMQAMALRGRNQNVNPDTVRLATIHSAKGLEFSNVWVVGLADCIIPSYQAIESGDRHLIEEERRNLFVAITRTKSKLTLSYPRVQKGWRRNRSRFLAEMFGSNQILPE